MGGADGWSLSQSSSTCRSSHIPGKGNPLLINSSIQPDLSVSRTYTSPMCFQDSMDKELMAEHSLLDPLPDIVVKGRGERAEYHVMSHPRTFPRGVAPDYQGMGVDATLGRRGKTLFIPHGLPKPPSPPLPPPLKTARVLGHAGGKLVVPNTGISLLVPRGGIAEDTSWEMYTIRRTAGVVVGAELPLKSVGQWVGSVVKMAAQSYSDVT
ncbi:unnamed protein product [Arctogadus glacialis]